MLIGIGVWRLVGWVLGKKQAEKDAALFRVVGQTPEIRSIKYHDGRGGVQTRGIFMFWKWSNLFTWNITEKGLEMTDKDNITTILPYPNGVCPFTDAEADK